MDTQLGIGQEKCLHPDNLEDTSEYFHLEEEMKLLESTCIK